MEPLFLTPNASFQSETLRAEHREIPLGSHARLDLTAAKSNVGTAQLARQFQNPDRMVGLHFCLNGKSFLNQGTHVAGAHLRDENCQLMLMMPYQTEQIMEFRDNFSLASFYIDLQHFASLLGSDFERLPEIFVRSAGLGNKCSCTEYRWTPGVFAVISQVLHTRFSGVANRIYLESKMLEIVALMLETQAEGQIVVKPSIRPPDLEKIHYARQLLLSDIANPPSLARLARLAGTNEFTLKKGFRELFGMPVFQLLQQTRMARAFELFVSDRTKSIAEIALEVGYDDHSAFTRAFAHHFGMRPSDVRR